MRDELFLKTLFHFFRLFIAIVIMATAGCKDDVPGYSQDREIEKRLPNDTRPNVVIIFTDDQGFADIGVNGQDDDVRTPHIDTLAREGVRMTNGYVTAPQCAPSRAALMTGMYQQRFGLDDNGRSPMTLEVKTVAERFQELGYRTGIYGKWNLEINSTSSSWIEKNFPEGGDRKLTGRIKADYEAFARGFDEGVSGYENSFWTNVDRNGNITDVRSIVNNGDRISFVNDGAAEFIHRNHDYPFFLYVAPYAPHVPLEAMKEYLQLFPSDLPERRRYALAMIATIDDGVGQIVSVLKQYGLYENTLIVFMSDNGAKLELDLRDVPIADDSYHWNGSLNTPLTGDKGMLTDGGIRVPFVVHWPARIPGGEVVDEPVSSLDSIFTALKWSGLDDASLSELDGVDLMPALLLADINLPASYLNERPLFWRFWHQSAVRLGNWKYLYTSDGMEYLFDISMPESANRNVILENQDIARQLRARLDLWDAQLYSPASTTAPNAHEQECFEYYLQQ